MKKIGTLLIFLFYAISISGASVRLSVCNGQVSSWHMVFLDGSAHENSKRKCGCCHQETTVRIKTDTSYNIQKNVGLNAAQSINQKAKAGVVWHNYGLTKESARHLEENNACITSFLYTYNKRLLVYCVWRI